MNTKSEQPLHSSENLLCSEAQIADIDERLKALHGKCLGGGSMTLTSQLLPVAVRPNSVPVTAGPGLAQSPLSPSEAINAIHRGGNALVSIESKTESGAWVRLATGTTIELFSSELLQPHLSDADVYFGLNSVYASYRSRRKSKITGMTVYSRKHLQHLNAVAVDLDQAHQPGQQFHFRSFLERVLRYSQQEGIPLPSIAINSGRGCWLLWLLADRRDQSQPVPAHPDCCNIVKRIGRAAIRKFESFGADRHCYDPERVCRIPGSINSASNSRVQFYRISDRYFTTAELGTAFDVHAHRTQITPRRTGEKGARQIPGGLERWRVPLRGIRALAEMRRKFPQGTRRYATYYYAVLCRRARVDNVEQAVMQFAEKYCPTLTLAQVKKCLHSSQQSHFHIRHDTLMRDLKITTKEQEVLSLWFKKPQPSCATKISHRHKMIRAEMELAVGAVSVRRMVDILKIKHGLTVGRTTVARDMQKITRNRPALGVMSMVVSQGMQTMVHA
ncbi:MAG: hypothetical protein DMG65_06030 [Candidatus Angelobacter sp. Gp1-AA117]|nr:MAG: hypothetical protein DMG65_06030 [Candidatus Angelobacter sp. Gp1-AA117]